MSQGLEMYCVESLDDTSIQTFLVVFENKPFHSTDTYKASPWWGGKKKEVTKHKETPFKDVSSSWLHKT